MLSLGLIGGTGLDHWGPVNRTHKIETTYGPASAPLAEYCVANTRVFFLPRHGINHQIPPHAVNYRANVDVFRQMEVDGIIAVNAVGGISGQQQPGRLSIPDQLIDYSWGREHTYSLGSEDELIHIEFAQPFQGRMRSRLLRAALLSDVAVIDGACVAVSQGPRLETAAEIKRFKRDGCDVVGMTSMPEAALAREAGLDYACLCVSANWAAGLEHEPVTMEAIDATLAGAMIDVRKLLVNLFEDISDVS